MQLLTTRWRFLGTKIDSVTPSYKEKACNGSKKICEHGQGDQGDNSCGEMMDLSKVVKEHSTSGFKSDLQCE